MAIILTKGENVALSELGDSLRGLKLELGWREHENNSGHDFDLDVSLFMLGDNDKAFEDQDCIYYRHPDSICRSVHYHEDIQCGRGVKKPELMDINLDSVPARFKKLVPTVTIHDGNARGQNFGQVSSAYVRLINTLNNKEIRYDLREECSAFTGIIFCEIYRYNNCWKYRALGLGVRDGLKECVHKFGLEVAND